MKFWFLPLLTVFCSGHIDLGTLNGFLTLTEVSDRISTLLSTYPGIISPGNSTSGFESFILSNSSSNPEYLKPQVLVLGGLYAGYPLGPYQVLEIADTLASQYTSDKTVELLINTYSFCFIPVPNVAAYNYMVANYNSTSFTFPVVETGLEGSASCSGFDLGINPNHNFPFQYGTYTDSCSNQYQGTSPLQSNVSSSLYNSFEWTGQVYFMFNYQGYGNNYSTPYAYSAEPLDSTAAYFYEQTEAFCPSGYEYHGAANMTGSLEYGTLLDFAFNSSVYAFEIGIGNTPELSEQSIQGLADDNYGFVVNTVYLAYPSLSYDFDDPKETKCEDIQDTNCAYYSVVVFTISIDNDGGLDYAFIVNFTAGFANNTDYTLINVTSSYENDWTSSVPTNLLYNTWEDNGITYYNVSDHAHGFSSYEINFTFSRAFENTTDNYNAVATFIADTNSFYVPPKVKTNSGDIGEGGRGGDNPRRRGILVGLILLIVLIILTFISGVVLYCNRRTREHDEKLPENPDMHLPNVARI